MSKSYEDASGGLKAPAKVVSTGWMQVLDSTKLRVCMLQVRSVTLDTWLPSQVAFMAATGNAAANAHYEAGLDPVQKPSYYSPDLDAFIRRKVCPSLPILACASIRACMGSQHICQLLLQHLHSCLCRTATTFRLPRHGCAVRPTCCMHHVGWCGGSSGQSPRAGTEWT